MSIVDEGDSLQNVSLAECELIFLIYDFCALICCCSVKCLYNNVCMCSYICICGQADIYVVMTTME